MRRAVAVAAGLIVLLLVNWGIYGRERLLTDGRVVLLELSPVDPRSLMQGDYMRLNFALADRAFPGGRTQRADGHLIIAVDPQGIARFRRRADAAKLAPDEIALRYRVRGGRATFATDAFFFEEGQAKVFENARFGEFRVGPDGEMMLTGLRGPRLEPLAAAAD